MYMNDLLNLKAEQQGIPPRTLEQVKTALTDAAKNGADRAFARLMLNHGRLTEEARDYLAATHPQD